MRVFYLFQPDDTEMSKLIRMIASFSLSHRSRNMAIRIFQARNHNSR